MSSTEQTGLGIVVPHDMVLDRELWRWAPDDVSLFFTRTPPSPRAATVAMIEEISGTESVSRATGALVATQSQAYAYACTTCSFIRGVAGEKALVTAMGNAGAPERGPLRRRRDLRRLHQPADVRRDRPTRGRARPAPVLDRRMT